MLHAPVVASARRFCVWLFAAALAVPVSAEAWTERASFGARVHGHGFHRVVLEASDCRLDYKLYFSAPSERYAGDKAHYRFKARLRLKDGRSFLSPIFGNSGAGERVYAARHDTAAEGCWAEQQQKIFAVDVQACKGRSCIPEPFE